MKIYIYSGKIALEEADESQSDLLDEIKKFNDKTRPKAFWQKEIKEITLDNLNNFYEAREMVLNGFKSKIFLTKDVEINLPLKYLSNFWRTPEMPLIN